MEWLIIFVLLLFGLGLIIVELIFVPGTTIVGIAGVVIGGYGIYITYNSYGNTMGDLVLSITLVVTLTALVITLKTKSWERFSLKDSNSSRVNDDIKVELQVGQEGLSVSSIRPIGKASFDDQILEVRSNGEYIYENVPVKIIRIDQNKIYIESLNKKSK
jgi:membrane-bound ClpP family serine protease